MQENSTHSATEHSSTLPSEKKSHRVITNLVFLLLWVMLIGGVIFLGFELFQMGQTVQKIEQTVHVMNNVQKVSEGTNTQRFESLSSASAHQQLEMAQLQSDLNSLKNRTPQKDEAMIKLAQLESFLRYAKVELDVHHNISHAILLLKQSEQLTNQLIKSANINSQMTNFHTQLLKTISLLQSLPVVNLNDLLASLEALNQQVPDLSILVAPKPNTTILVNTPHQAHKHWYQRAWDNIKASFQALIIVTHHENKMPPLMAPEEQLYLQENLQLTLVRAQWALMQHDSDLYQKSLNQAMAWVEKYYVQNSASTMRFYKELQKLSHQGVIPQTPDLNPLINALPVLHQEN